MATDIIDQTDPAHWDPKLDAVIAAPANHKVVFENDRLRVLEVILEPNEQEPTHHHRWPSVFVFDQVQGPIHDFAPDGTMIAAQSRRHTSDPSMGRSGLPRCPHGPTAGRSCIERIGQNAARHPRRDEVVARTTSFSRS